MDIDGDGDPTSSSPKATPWRCGCTPRVCLPETPWPSWPSEAGANILVGDIDQDGRPDLYLVVGCGSGSRNLPDMMLVNEGER